MKFNWQNSYIILIRDVLGELGLGLGISWVVLVLIEFIRPGAVSLYFDINLILLLALVGWCLGSRRVNWFKEKYVIAILFGILVWIAGLHVAGGGVNRLMVLAS